MSNRKSAWAVTITAVMLLSSVLVFLSQNASASAVTWTSDADFLTGNFFRGTGFETELHGTGVDAYVQNKEDMLTWLQMSPASDPGPRSDFAFANDSLEGRFILFGGLDGNSQWRNDTWEYDIASDDWVRICSDDGCPPSKRMDPSMAYDGNSRVAVMYGGLSEDGSILTDTWEYDVMTDTWENWTMVFRPRDLASHSMVYDAVDQRIILVGQGIASMEVWAYTQTTHTWTNMSTIGGPSRRYGFALGYSYQPSHKRVVLFGGAEVMTLYDDTWEYNYASNSWSQVNPVTKPSARTDASMTYDFHQSIEGLILWGGNSWSTETWRYYWEGGIPTWSQLPPIAAPTPGRKDHGLAYDQGYGKLILYGGTSLAGSSLNDTWMLENGYRLEGRYASSYFNTYDTGSIWHHIFWNQTPANVPLNTIIRFQIDTSNTCNNSDLPYWRGPNGASNTYYTSPGEAIWGGGSPSKCIRFLADLINFDSSVAAELQDVTIIYDMGDPGLPPKVASVSPTLNNVPLNAPILINFTRPMDPGNVFISVIPNVTFGPPIWGEGNSKVKYNHNAAPFLEAHRYDVCVWGADTLGRPLDYPNGRYCWAFVTKLTRPVIVGTIPPANSIDVSLNAPIVITFSEPMNTSTCWPYVTIDPVSPPALAFDGHSWSMGDTTLTMTHSVPFAPFTTYTIELPMNDPTRPCLDKSGGQLDYGAIVNPWSFTTIVNNPFITVTDPTNLQTMIPVDNAIIVKFSKDMDVNILYYAFKEYDGISWENSTTTLIASWTSPRNLTLGHSTDFSSCKPYQMQVWALDTYGRPLVNNPSAPNPWRFETGNPEANGCPPYMVFTSPYNGEENVSQLKNISIVWHYDPVAPGGGMEPSKFTYSIRDGFGTDVTSLFVPYWFGMGPDMVELRHPGYYLGLCMQYTVKVLTAKDKLGRDFVPGMAENPFMFKTSWPSCPPVILWTQPADGASNVPFNQDIKVKFSKTMDIASVMVAIRPTMGINSFMWSEAYTNLTITHMPFQACTVYSVFVDGSDTSGNRLAPGPVPNPWSFSTGPCAVIISTDPADGSMSVPILHPITVIFSDPMNISSVVVDIVPDIALAYNWSNNNRILVLTHSTPFNPLTIYSVTVNGKTATGFSLGPGPVPNPWQFTTTCLCSVDGLAVHRLPPADVSLTWRSNPSLVHYKVFHSTDRFAPWPWTVIADVATNYYLAAGHNADMSNHFYIVRGYMVDGSETANSTMGTLWHASASPGPGKTITFWFSLPYHTIYKKASDIANELTSAKIDVVAKWDLAKHKSVVYYFFHGRWRGDDFDINMGDGLWLDVVSALDWAVNGTDTLHALEFRANPSPKQNYNFISLPYTNVFPDAESISDLLSSSKIVEVGRWDVAAQGWQKWTWSGGAWAGMNFAILPGDGIYLLIVDDFVWAPWLITPEFP